MTDLLLQYILFSAYVGLHMSFVVNAFNRKYDRESTCDSYEYNDNLSFSTLSEVAPTTLQKCGRLAPDIGPFYFKEVKVW